LSSPRTLRQIIDKTRFAIRPGDAATILNGIFSRRPDEPALKAVPTDGTGLAA
jgi:hypothetical protein